jgi:hypothetical protein
MVVTGNQGLKIKLLLAISHMIRSVSRCPPPRPNLRVILHSKLLPKRSSSQLPSHLRQASTHPTIPLTSVMPIKITTANNMANNKEHREDRLSKIVLLPSSDRSVDTMFHKQIVLLNFLKALANKASLVIPQLEKLKQVDMQLQIRPLKLNNNLPRLPRLNRDIRPNLKDSLANIRMVTHITLARTTLRI